MKPIRLRLRGFAGIRAGMGRDEVELDLSMLANQGLIALAGHNGSGKTTLLDNLHPYRIMPSRANGDGFGAFSFYEHLCLPDAAKELEWEHEGVRYRSQLVFRINGKRKTEAYLHEWQGDRWTPVCLPDGTRSDGKTDTYDACVQALLGSAETFFTSVFSAQSKRSLSDYRNSEIKTLLSDLLGLQSIRDLGSRAGDVSRQTKLALGERRHALNTAESDLAKLMQELTGLGDVNERLARHASERAAAQASVDQARADLAARQATLSAAQSVEEQRSRLAGELTAARSAAKAALEGAEESIRREERRLQSLITAAAEKRRAAQAKRSLLLEERETLQHVLTAAPAISRAERHMPKALRVQERRTERQQALAPAREELAAAEGRARAFGAQLQALEREAGQAVLRKTDLERRLGLSTRVPCAGTDLQGRCELLADAHEARALMPAVDIDLGRFAEGRSQLKQEQANAVAEVERCRVRVQQLDQAAARLRRTLQRLRYLERMVQSKGEVELASKRLAALGPELQDAERLATAARNESEDLEIAGARQALKQASDRRAQTDLDGRAATAAVEAALQRLPPPADQSAVTQASDRLARELARLKASEQGYADALRAQEAARQVSATASAARSRIQTERERVKALETEALHWSLLARGLSNDGVIALSIDDAGPTLAGLTNDLLLACYGPRFTVSIRTEVATAKGDLREGFDIVVHDAISDETKSVSVMSGGERVWVNECLTRAIAVYLSQNSGRKYGALFSDEADGPLDPDRKRMFMAMKREVLRLGGYELEFFVSQTPELTAMADVVIDVEALAKAAPPASSEAPEELALHP